MESADIEIEALCSIWDGVHVAKISETEISVKLKIKSLEDEFISASVLLEVRIFEGYPSVIPRVLLSYPRGIGEPEFYELRRQIDEIIDKNEDEMPIIMQIFQHCSDFLTENQHINMDCSICLVCLSAAPIIVTSCDHFMHSDCFCRYLSECLAKIRAEIEGAQPHMKERVETNILCPVCREQLTESNTIRNYDSEIRKMIADAKNNERKLKPKIRRISTTSEDVQKTIKRWNEEQRRLQGIFERQKENGGIIDVEEDRKRRQFFIGAVRTEEDEDVEIGE